ncbi:MAG: hypothetical protein QOD72_548 [Acidimicrobiaceae bacterium]|jgi:hypothetical protein|nr:hypothetical protein [Acidimicrobiaceae bacterium]
MFPMSPDLQLQASRPTRLQREKAAARANLLRRLKRRSTSTD